MIPNIKIIILTIAVTFFSCGADKHKESERETAENTALAAAQSIYTLRYKEAMKHCTASSVNELKYMASILTQTDIDVLNNSEKPLLVSIDDFEWKSEDSDSAATVSIVVENFLQLDSINRNGEIKDKATIRYQLVKEADGWKVDLSRR